MGASLRFPQRQSARRHAVAALRNLSNGRACPIRRGARSGRARVDLCRDARIRARLPGRALRGRPRGGARAGRGRAPGRDAHDADVRGAQARDPGARAGRRAVSAREQREAGYAERAEELIEGPLPGEQDDDDLTEDVAERGLEMVRNRRRVLGLLAAVVLMVVAIYVVLPKVAGLGDTVARIGDATWYWIPVACAFNVVSFISYTALFRSVMGRSTFEENDEKLKRRLSTRVSYEITMAGFGATILFSAAGAGGVALTYWALRKAGMERWRTACRMVAFLVLLYSVYLLSLILFGILLRTHVLPGEAPVAGTIIPAAIAAGALALVALTALIPGDMSRRIGELSSRSSRLARFAGTIAKGPARVATGVRTAATHVRHPIDSLETILGAVGWWAGNIGVLWACFQAFGVHVPFAVLVQGYFLGMVANLAPSPAAGVGTVDAGLIGAFVVLGIDAHTVFPAILLFRFVGFWLPIPVGVWAFLKLRHTTQRWTEEDRRATIKSEVRAAEA